MWNWNSSLLPLFLKFEKFGNWHEERDAVQVMQEKSWMSEFLNVIKFDIGIFASHQQSFSSNSDAIFKSGKHKSIIAMRLTIWEVQVTFKFQFNF